MTITEALAEIKTISARIQKKRQFVLDNIARVERLKDPLEKQGGSPRIITQEMQAIADLEARTVKIRTVIQASNSKVPLTVGDHTHTVSEWLAWRRDVSQGSKSFLEAIGTATKNARGEAKKRAVSVRGPDANEGQPDDIVVHVDEVAVQSKLEGIVTTLGVLDGRLSLMNATTQVEV